MTISIQDVLAANEKLAKEQLAPGADLIDATRSFPRQNLQALGHSGVLGLLVPTEFGGAGGGIPEMVQVVERMALACASTAMVTLIHYCGTAVIVAQGSTPLKQRLLPAIASGQHHDARFQRGGLGRTLLHAGQRNQNNRGWPVSDRAENLCDQRRRSRQLCRLGA